MTTDPLYASPPQNAWLLIGDGASFPSPTELQELRDDWPDRALQWTAAKTTALGDLVLIYFVAPHKAARFVARAASDAFWTNDVEVNADNEVADEQWWVELSPLVEIDPIPFKDLQQAAGGYLNLRGRSGHYITPTTLAGLSLQAARASDEDLLESIVQVPIGHGELGDPKGSFEEWRAFASGAFKLEEQVSQFVVEPMLRANILLTLVGGWQPQYRCAAGIVDYIIYGNAATSAWDDPVAAIEVKLAIRLPKNDNDWMTSPDFRQLSRYMTELQVPGALVDAQNVFFFERGAVSPYRWIHRPTATRGQVFDAFRDFQEHMVGDPPNGSATNQYVLWNVPSQRFTGRPFLIVEASRLEDLPTSVRPHPAGGESAIKAAADLTAVLTDARNRTGLTVAQLAVSYGGITDINLNPLPPDEPAPRSRRRRPTPDAR